jgi:hypothetical protein
LYFYYSQIPPKWQGEKKTNPTRKKGKFPKGKETAKNIIVHDLFINLRLSTGILFGSKGSSGKDVTALVNPRMKRYLYFMIAGFGAIGLSLLLYMLLVVRQLPMGMV